jgi:hypothetical protein
MQILPEIFAFYTKHSEYQRYLRTFIYSKDEALLFLVGKANNNLKEISISQFGSYDHLIFTLKCQADFRQILKELVANLFKSADLQVELPYADIHISGCTFKLSLPLKRKELITKLLSDLDVYLNGDDKINFAILSGLIRQQLNLEISDAIDSLFTRIKHVTEIEDIAIPNLSDIPHILREIELKKVQAKKSEKESLRLRLIQTGHENHSPTKPGYFYLNTGFPCQGMDSTAVPINQIESLISEIRGIPNFTYSDAISFVNNAIIQYDKEELYLIPDKPPYSLDSLPSFDHTLFEIRYINDAINFGVFARQDIPKGTPLGIFSGLNGLPLLSYGYSLIDMNPELGEELCEISPERSGNWVHLVNHAPTRPEPDENHKETVNEQLRNSIQLANTEEQWTNMSGYRYPIIVATKKIEKGMQLLFDYEPYWHNWLSRKGKLRYFIKENDSYRIVNHEGIASSNLPLDSANFLKVKKVITENAGKGAPASTFWLKDNAVNKQSESIKNTAAQVGEHKQSF